MTTCPQCGANGDLLPDAHEVEYARLTEEQFQDLVSRLIPTYPRQGDWEWLVRFVYTRAFERGVWARVNRDPARMPERARKRMTDTPNANSAPAEEST